MSARDTHGILQEPMPGESSLAFCSCSKYLCTGSSKANDCLLEHVVSETLDVGGPLAPIRQLSWLEAAAAVWVGGEEACSEPPGRLLLLHCVDLGWVVQNIVISVASLMLSVSL